MYDVQEEKSRRVAATYSFIPGISPEVVRISVGIVDIVAALLVFQPRASRWAGICVHPVGLGIAGVLLLLGMYARVESEMSVGPPLVMLAVLGVAAMR